MWSFPGRVSLSPLGTSSFPEAAASTNQVAACAFTNSTPSRARVAYFSTVEKPGLPGKLSIASHGKLTIFSGKYHQNDIKMVDFPASFMLVDESVCQKIQQFLLKNKKHLIEIGENPFGLLGFMLCWGHRPCFSEVTPKRFSKKIATSLHLHSTYSAFIHLVNPKKVVITSKDVLFQMQKKQNKNSPTSFLLQPKSLFEMLTNLGYITHKFPTHQRWHPCGPCQLWPAHLSRQRLKVGSFTVGTEASHGHNRVIHLQRGTVRLRWPSSGRRVASGG